MTSKRDLEKQLADAIEALSAPVDPERIAAVFKKHRRVKNEVLPLPMRECACGDVFGPGADAEWHVARAIAKELRRQRDDATEQRNLFQAAHDEAIRERNQARAEREELRRQRDEARKHADELSSANATLRAQVRAWQTEHDECDADSRIAVLNHVQTSLQNLASYVERTK